MKRQVDTGSMHMHMDTGTQAQQSFWAHAQLSEAFLLDKHGLFGVLLWAAHEVSVQTSLVVLPPPQGS